MKQIKRKNKGKVGVRHCSSPRIPAVAAATSHTADSHKKTEEVEYAKEDHDSLSMITEVPHDG